MKTLKQIWGGLKYWQKGFVIFAIPPLLLALFDWIWFSFDLVILFEGLRTVLIPGGTGILLGLIYHSVLKAATSHYKLIAKIVIGLYYLAYLIYFSTIAYFIIFVGDLMGG